MTHNPFWTLGPGKHLRSFRRWLSRNERTIVIGCFWIAILANLLHVWRR